MSHVWDVPLETPSTADCRPPYFTPTHGHVEPQREAGFPVQQAMSLTTKRAD